MQATQEQELTEKSGYSGESLEKFRSFVTTLKSYGFSAEELLTNADEVRSLFTLHGDVSTDQRLTPSFNTLLTAIPVEQFEGSRLKALEAFYSIARSIKPEDRPVDLDVLDQKIQRISEHYSILRELNINSKAWFVLRLDSPKVSEAVQKFGRQPLIQLFREFHAIGNREFNFDHESVESFVSWIGSTQKIEKLPEDKLPSLTPLTSFISRWNKDAYEFFARFDGMSTLRPDMPVPLSAIAQNPEFQAFLEKEESRIKLKDVDRSLHVAANIGELVLIFLGQDEARKITDNKMPLAGQIYEGKISEANLNRIHYVSNFELIKQDFFTYDSLNNVSQSDVGFVQTNLESGKRLQVALEEVWKIKSYPADEFKNILADKKKMEFLTDPSNVQVLREKGTKFNLDTSEQEFVNLERAHKLVSLIPALERNETVLRKIYPDLFTTPVMASYTHVLDMFKRESDVDNLANAIDKLKSYIDFNIGNIKAEQALLDLAARKDFSITDFIQGSKDPKRHEMAKFFGAKYARGGTFSVNNAPEAVAHIFKIKNIDKAYQFFSRAKDHLSVSNYKDIPLE